MNVRIRVQRARRALLVMFLVFGSAATSLGQTTGRRTSPSAGETVVLETHQQASAAFEQGDVAFLTDFLDETFTLTDSRGQVTTRAQNLAEVKAREPRYDVFRNHSMRVRLYGDAAVVTGITSIKGSSGGQAFAADFQFTDTLIRRHGQWRMVASHASALAKP
jgi:ketosteroid isomerase-like protein